MNIISIPRKKATALLLALALAFAALFAVQAASAPAAHATGGCAYLADKPIYYVATGPTTGMKVFNHANKIVQVPRGGSACGYQVYLDNPYPYYTNAYIDYWVNGVKHSYQINWGTWFNIPTNNGVYVDVRVNT